MPLAPRRGSRPLARAATRNAGLVPTRKAGPVGSAGAPPSLRRARGGLRSLSCCRYLASSCTAVKPLLPPPLLHEGLLAALATPWILLTGPAEGPRRAPPRVRASAGCVPVPRPRRPSAASGCAQAPARGSLGTAPGPQRRARSRTRGHRRCTRGYSTRGCVSLHGFRELSDRRPPGCPFGGLGKRIERL